MSQWAHKAAEERQSPLPFGLAALARFVDIRPGEGWALVWSWAYISMILASYYMLRPIRDQMGVAGGLENLPWLFMGTLLSMLALTIPFAWLVKRLPRARFIPLTYRFFAVNILLFAVAIYTASPDQLIWIGRVFFVWLSVFNLFVVSIFWSTIVDVFSTEQGKRLFAFIGAGATIGAISGSAVTALLAYEVPTWGLLAAAALLLEVAVFAMRKLAGLPAHLHETPSSQADEERAIGGSPLAGITHAFRSRYLTNIGVYLLLFTVTSTFLYFEQAAIAKSSFPDRGAQAAFFASVDLAVNVLTLSLQIFLSGRIVKRFGIGLTLAVLPALSVIGFATLAVSPTIMVIVGLQVLRRAGDYAIAKPTREVLFTVVPREDRYKAKNFIDTVVYRAGDQIGAWVFAGLAAEGLSRTLIAIVASLLSALWLLNSLWLGRAQSRRQQAIESATYAPDAANQPLNASV